MDYKGLQKHSYIPFLSKRVDMKAIRNVSAHCAQALFVLPLENIAVAVTLSDDSYSPSPLLLSVGKCRCCNLHLCAWEARMKR